MKCLEWKIDLRCGVDLNPADPSFGVPLKCSVRNEGSMRLEGELHIARLFLGGGRGREALVLILLFKVVL